MSQHEGVSCDCCLQGNFRGRRYKCLICYDYDSCSSCYENGATSNRHTVEHPVQCILTRADYDLFYGGESISVQMPQSFTCPFCGQLGLSESGLHDHVRNQHADCTNEVICAICASIPGGEPNNVTDDFAAHLAIAHRNPSSSSTAGVGAPAAAPLGHGNVHPMSATTSGGAASDASRALDMGVEGHQGLSSNTAMRGRRALNSSRTGRRPNGVQGVLSAMNGGASASGASASSSSVAAASLVRDMDPIAELLSQLSTAHRRSQTNSNGNQQQVGGGSITTTTNSSSGNNLHALQMQLQRSAPSGRGVTSFASMPSSMEGIHSHVHPHSHPHPSSARVPIERVIQRRNHQRIHPNPNGSTGVTAASSFVTAAAASASSALLDADELSYIVLMDNNAANGLRAGEAGSSIPVSVPVSAIPFSSHLFSNHNHPHGSHPPSGAGSSLLNPSSQLIPPSGMIHPSSSSSSTASRYLLSRPADRKVSESEIVANERRRADKSLFLHELILSSLGSSKMCLPLNGDKCSQPQDGSPHGPLDGTTEPGIVLNDEYDSQEDKGSDQVLMSMNQEESMCLASDNESDSDEEDDPDNEEDDDDDDDQDPEQDDD